MKVTRFLLSALFLGALATTASAQGAASLNWDNCTGPINKAILPGTPAASMFVSVLGQTEAHKAYDVQVTLGSGNFGPLRDAWRFDAAGCQGSAFLTINHISKVCPSFQGALASIQIKDYSYDATTGKARALLANTYPAGQTVVSPATRYFLAQFLFDHTYSVNGPTTPGADCGGLEVAVCAHLTNAAWLDMNGVEYDWAIANEYVTANDPNNTTGCPGATPTVDKTWGSLKAQYKR